MFHPTHPFAIHSPTDIARKLHDHFPQADDEAVSEYVDALRSYEVDETAASLNRLITAAQLLALPTIHLEQF